MNEENTLTVKITTRICLTLATLFAFGIGGCVYINHKAMTEGYEEAQTVGTTGTIWVKKGKPTP